MALNDAAPIPRNSQEKQLNIQGAAYILFTCLDAIDIDTQSTNVYLKIVNRLFSVQAKALRFNGIAGILGAEISAP